MERGSLLATPFASKQAVILGCLCLSGPEQGPGHQATGKNGRTPIAEAFRPSGGIMKRLRRQEYGQNAIYL